MILRLVAVIILGVVAACASPALSGSGWSQELSLGLEGPVNSPERLTAATATRQTHPPTAPFAVSLRQEFGLPPIHDVQSDAAAEITDRTQVFQRARLLNIDSGTADTSWKAAADTVTADRAILPTLLQQPLRRLTFRGTRLSELNAAIAAAGPAHITVTSRTLQADTGLTITGQNLILDFAGAAIDVGAQPPLWLVSLVNARHVAVLNAQINGGTNGFLVNNSSDVAIEGNDVERLTQNGIVLTGQSSDVDIHANHLHDLGRAGIMLHGPVTTALLEDNEIDHLQGHSNWNAGILLTGRDGDIAADPNAFLLPDHYWVVTEQLVRRLKNPSQNVILGNRIHDSLSSGIYNDGAIANVFVENRIAGNAKEGICFDNGATANVFAGNIVRGNGRRWGQPDAVLALDSVLGAGRAADGTSNAKLPGISVDNALYNEIVGNYIDVNDGGGVKMVRTGLFNVIVANTISDNNLGASPRFHFFGVELGGAPADAPVVDLDFVGSSGNVIYGNAIHGQHYAGVFIGSDSVQNDVLRNDITGALAFAVEAQGR